MKLLFAAVCVACLTVNAQAGCYEQLKARMPQAGTIIFGELHGTAEIPKFFFDCVREFAANKEPIRIFLEFQASENATVEKFMRGQIGESELIQEPNWARQDGRSSMAMLALFRDLKSLPAAQLRVVGFDISRNEPDREKAMADNYFAEYSLTGYNLVLTGNVHARLTRAMSWNPDLVPFAMHLNGKLENVVSLNVRYPAGSAWVCTPDCGIKELNATDARMAPDDDKAVVYSLEDPAYSGYFRVSSISASRPVIEKASR